MEEDHTQFISGTISDINTYKSYRPTNTATAKSTRPDSIRALYGFDGTKNATHGSDSVTSAKREINFFFDVGGSNG
jgi:nucleoside diphosphate kinase